MLVCGDRNWLTYYNENGTLDRVKIRAVRAGSYRLLDRLAKWLDVDVLIEGCARGADRMAEDWSLDMSCSGAPQIRENIHYPAEWDKYGRSAGPIRNMKMLDEGRPDFVVAFHDNLADSKGTRHMVEIADAAGVPVYAFTLKAVLDAYGT